MRHLTEVETAQAVTLLQERRSFRHVANVFQVSVSVIHRLWTRFQDTGEYTRRVGQGRRRATTANEDRYVRLTALRHRTRTARDIGNDLRSATGTRVSDQTIRNRLREANLRARRPNRVPNLTQRHRRARLYFARQHQHRQLRHWRPVLFTDESRFRLTRCDGRLRVWRRRGERDHAAVMQGVDRCGGGSVMVWGGISIESRTDLVVVPRTVTAMSYTNTILQNHVLPIAVRFGPAFELMHDNARPHTARVMQNFLQTHNIRVIDWPAMSPDLNPIEHVWDMLDRRVRQRPQAPGTLQELRQALVEEWDGIPQEDIRRIVRSMPRRCQAVLHARGGNTRY